MTLAMPDSVNVNRLPPGYDAYLGYVDGEYSTAAALRAMFPAAQLVLLTVTGNTLEATGADVENFDLSPEGGAAWARRKLATAVDSRPVLYASVSAMKDVRGALAALGIDAGLVRLLSAHFGDGPHICGPHSCGLSDIEMDGTQWSNTWVTAETGAFIDMSMLADSFFGPLSETEVLVQELGTVQAGMTGAAVKTVQGLCNARGSESDLVAIDGVFGNQTLSAVKFLQSIGKVTVDGIVGPRTWPILLGIG